MKHLLDEERSRIAQELHDTTSELLTRLVARLYALRRHVATNDTELIELADESLTLAEATANVLRSASEPMQPSTRNDAVSAHPRHLLEVCANSMRCRTFSPMFDRRKEDDGKVNPN